jgi:transcriptional regulator with XRE-family HTH domain
MARHAMSGVTTETLLLLADAVRVGRLRRGWTVGELAERVGVSRPTITKLERGDPGVAVGTVLEAAHLVGVPMFDADPDVRRRERAHKRTELALLPATARPRRAVDDAF